MFFLSLKIKISSCVEHLMDWIRPDIHPSKMSQDEIAAELENVWAEPYSRKNQRRAAVLLDSDGDSEFAGEPAEDVFERIVGLAMLVSMIIEGKPTTVQHSYASMMLYRICIIGSTITDVYREHEKSPQATLDYGSIAVLCRTILDASIMYWYLTEIVDDAEWAFRLAVLKVHDSASRVRLFKGLDPDEADKQRRNLATLKADLARLPLFKARCEEEQRKLLSGQTLYVNGMRALLGSMNIGKQYFDGFYNYLSAHVHLTPLSYFRARPGSVSDIRFARGFMQLCLYEAARIIARVALREIGLSQIESDLDVEQLNAMRRFGASAMGTN